MNFTANRKSLVDALGLVVQAVPKRSIKPMLLNVRVAVHEAGKATLVGTDTVVLAHRNLCVDYGIGDEAVLLNAQRLMAIAQAAASDEIEVNATDSEATIISGSARWTLPTDADADADDFPSPKTKGARVKLSPLDIIEIEKRVAGAAANERTRYALNGVSIKVDGNQLTATGTDGKRLARLTVDLKESCEAASCLIPKKGLSLFARAAKECQSELVQLFIGEREAALCTDDATVTTLLVSGDFPDANRVIPKDTPYVARIGSDDLSAALRQAEVLTTDESLSVRMRFFEGVCEITSRSDTAGQSRVTVECEYDGEEFSVAFNPEYLLAGLKAVNQETVELAMSGKDTPALLRGDDRLTYLTMPVTLRVQ